MNLIREMKKLKQSLPYHEGPNCLVFSKDDWITVQTEQHARLHECDPALAYLLPPPPPLKLNCNMFSGLPVFTYETEDEKVSLIIELKKKYKNVGVLA